MIFIIFLTYLFCIFDYVCTRHWIEQFGVEVEANPIGKWLFSFGGGVFAFLVKCVLSLAALIFLYCFRSNTFGKVGIWALFLTYLAVTIYHIVIIIKVSSL